MAKVQVLCLQPLTLGSSQEGSMDWSCDWSVWCGRHWGGIRRSGYGFSVLRYTWILQQPYFLRIASPRGNAIISPCRILLSPAYEILLTPPCIFSVCLFFCFSFWFFFLFSLFSPILHLNHCQGDSNICRLRASQKLDIV